MRTYFEKLFKYNHWANQRYLRALMYYKGENRKILQLYSHLVSAQKIWFNRIQDLPTSSPWVEYKPEELQSLTIESTDQWLKFISDYPTDIFEKKITYKNTKGQQFETKVDDVIIHVINHSTYHRSQIAILFRQENIDPPITDYIAYIRES